MSEFSAIARQRALARRDGGPAYQDRRAQISRAAALEFKRRGYQATTLAHIAEAMGSDRASLYYYVSGKQELYEEIVSEALRTNVARATAIAGGPGPGAARVGALLRSVMESFDEFYPVIYVLLGENLRDLDAGHSEWARETRDVVVSWEQLLVDLVAEGQRDGSVRDNAPAWLIARALTGMFAWTYRWYTPGGEVTATEIGDVFAGLVAQALAPVAG